MTHQYAYRTEREGKTVKKFYLGRGACAREMMAMQELSRLKARSLQVAEAEEEAKLWPLQKRMSLVAAEAKQGLEALYYATGHYRSRCRHWRRRKMDTGKTPESILHADTADPAIGQPELTEERRAELKRSRVLRSLCERIKAGETHLRSKLRKLLREEDPEIIRRFADLTELVADRWAAQIATQNEVARASIVMDAMDQRKALAPPGSTPVEQILANRVVF